MLKIISLRWYRRLIKGKMCIVDCTAQINVDVIQHRPRRTLLMLPHDGHADTDPLSLLTAFISLIPSSCFPPFCMQSTVHMHQANTSQCLFIFSFWALHAQFLSLITCKNSVIHGRPLRCCNIHTPMELKPPSCSLGVK